MNSSLPDDIDIGISPICQYCGKECDRTEFVWTGDNESYKGWELWCYCDTCKTDTFHKLKKHAE